MARKVRKITEQGQRVLGALATYLTPKLAEDKKLKAGELDRLVKSIKPNPVFDKQIPGIIGTIKERFTSRLAQDAALDPDEIKDLLESLGGTGEPDDDDDDGDSRGQQLQVEHSGGWARSSGVGSNP